MSFYPFAIFEDDGAGRITYRTVAAGVGTAYPIFSIYHDDVLRIQISSGGIQEWYLGNSGGERGKISYGTPGGNVGMSMYTGATYDQNRFDIENRSTFATFGYDDAPNGGANFCLWPTGYAYFGGTTEPTAQVHIAGSDSDRASLRIAAGTAPTTPNDGDIWKLSDTFVLFGENSTTSSVVNTLRLRRSSSGTPTAGFGVGINAQLKSSTTQGQDAGRLIWSWNVATHASRAAKGRLTAYYTATERECISWAAGSAGPKVGFFGTAPADQGAAYTQTYSTADRTFSAYTADNESSAYSGIDNAQGGSVYAQLTDLNALRTAYENLRAFAEDMAGVVNSVVDDMQSLGLAG